MKKIVSLLTFILILGFLSAQNQYDIIPKPVSLTAKEGVFKTTLRSILEKRLLIISLLFWKMI